ncbi:MAG: O-antigen ligase family protein [Acetobacteraceae bacterium]
MTAGRIATNAAGVVAAGMLCTMLAAVVPEVGPKTAIAGGFALLLLLSAVVSGLPKEVFLAGYILSLTYNRQYFAFDAWLGASGSNGLYWIPADPFLFLLLGVSVWERLIGHRTTHVHRVGAPPGAGPVLPFLAVCCVSALLSQRPDWGFNDVYRVVKFAILLLWLHYNLNPRLWLVAVCTFAAAIAMQSALGVLQVATNAGSGLLSMIGLGTAASGVAAEIENRARGTMGHPNYLAPYLLMVVPAAFGAVLYSRRRPVILASAAVAALGVAGTVATASRSPIVILAATMSLVAATAVWQRVLSARMALGCGILALGLLAAVALPFTDKIAQRLEGDLTASVDFRLSYNLAALAIWDDHPLLGIGPNNSILEIGRHAPLFEQIIRSLDEYRDAANVRASPVHNVYLLMLSETGVVGLVAFLYLLASVIRRGVRGAAASEYAVRGICVGAVIGLLGQFTQQTVDFSLWYDSSWYTLALMAGLLGAVPDQAARIG